MLIVDDFDVEQIAGKARVAEVKFRAFDQSLGDVLVVGRKEVYHTLRMVLLPDCLGPVMQMTEKYWEASRSRGSMSRVI